MSDTLVHILDDDRSVRRSLQQLLRATGWPVAVHESFEGFCSAAAVDGVGCLLLDVRLGEDSGLDVLEELERRQSPLGVVLISGFGDAASIVRGMRHGAVDFLTKPFEDSALLAAVAAATLRSHERALEISKTKRAHERVARLTRRERQVCGLVARGMLNKQIAAEIGAAEKTVKIDRGRVMKKLEVKSVAELVRLVDCVAPPAR